MNPNMNPTPTTNSNGRCVEIAHAAEPAVRRTRGFDDADLRALFASDVYNGQNRRYGRSLGEAPYWIPVLMSHLGLRAVEVAALSVHDVITDGPGRYELVVGRGLATELSTPSSRALDTAGSAYACRRAAFPRMGTRSRTVPLPQGIVDLGFLRFRQWQVEQGYDALFPTLVGPAGRQGLARFRRAFSRHIESLGIAGKGKSLDSLPLSAARRLVQAGVASHTVAHLVGRTLRATLGMEFASIARTGQGYRDTGPRLPPIHPWRPRCGKGVS